MQTGSMNKLAKPDCTACGGLGRLRVARSLDNAGAESKRALPAAGVGFMWIDCNPCGGSGKR